MCEMVSKLSQNRLKLSYRLPLKQKRFPFPFPLTISPFTSPSLSSNSRKPVRKHAICPVSAKKPPPIPCHVVKTPYLCTRFPKGRRERDL